ncbi:hypothetical protein AYO44_12530 [Planctomycetaceae bacterium SCGC AG-212-F19]|nr:hypothetical protein AYO44_12530 [Planctomycetaceae bacterium SCGC AG-212-F19]
MIQPDELWVVYMMTLHANKPALNAVCEQSEWDAMELSRPGYHTLIQSGIASESEADKIARQRMTATSPFLPKDRGRTTSQGAATAVR